MTQKTDNSMLCMKVVCFLEEELTMSTNKSPILRKILLELDQCIIDPYLSKSIRDSLQIKFESYKNLLFEREFVSPKAEIEEKSCDINDKAKSSANNEINKSTDDSSDKYHLSDIMVTTKPKIGWNDIVVGDDIKKLMKRAMISVCSQL